MRPHTIANAMVAIIASVGISAHAATVSSVGTTGVFDANSNTNAIDNDPTGQLAAFTAAVATAYANNSGGVIDWSTGAGTLDASGTSPSNYLDTSVTVSYGVGAGESLTITPDRRLGLYTNNVANQVVALSDTTSLLVDTGTFANDKEFGLSFSGAPVIEVGFGMLARSTYGDAGVAFSATATFSDNSTSAPINFTLSATKGASDTFLHFSAPGGLTISSIFVDFVADNGVSDVNDAQTRPSMDDLGFIVATIPEPGSLALLGVGGLMLARRRTR